MIIFAIFSKDDVKRLENSIKILADKMGSINVLEYAFKVSQVDASFLQISRDLTELKRKSSERCKCGGGSRGHDVSHASTTTANQGTSGTGNKRLLETILEKLETYGNKLLPGHASLLEKMADMRNLIQSGFTKMLLSLMPINSLSQNLEAVKVSLGTKIDDKFLILSSVHDSMLRESAIIHNNAKKIASVVVEGFSNISDALDIHSSVDEATQWETVELINRVLNQSSTCQTLSTSPTSMPSATVQDLRTDIQMLSSKTEGVATKYKAVDAEMFTWRNNMEIHCSKTLFKAYRLCRDADNFIDQFKKLEIPEILRLSNNLRTKLGLPAVSANQVSNRLIVRSTSHSS